MAAGLQDGRAGLSIDNNPYAPGTEAASVWEAGWHIATETTELQQAQVRQAEAAGKAAKPSIYHGEPRPTPFRSDEE